MKIKTIPAIIAIAFSLLITYSFYNYSSGLNKNLVAIFIFISTCISLILSLGINYKFERIGVNIKVISIIFLIGNIIWNILFTLLNLNLPIYIIISGLGTLIYFYISYTIYQTSK